MYIRSNAPRYCLTTCHTLCFKEAWYYTLQSNTASHHCTTGDPRPCWARTQYGNIIRRTTSQMSAILPKTLGLLFRTAALRKSVQEISYKNTCKKRMQFPIN